MTTFDVALGQAAWTGKPVLYVGDRREAGTVTPFNYADHVGGETLASLVAEHAMGPAWVIQPSGLFAPLYATHTVWMTEREPFLATGNQLIGWCRRTGTDPKTVVAAPDDRLSGTCLICGNPARGGRHWWMVQPRTLPAFRGIRD